MITGLNYRFSGSGPRGSRSLFLCRSVLFLTGALFLTGFQLRCGRPAAPPPEVQEKYQAQAHRLCKAITECIKEDVARRFSGTPQRRDMVLRRMTQDLCLKGQYRLIGDLSVDPDPDKKSPAYNPEFYRLYSECSRVVSEAADCRKRQELHRTHPACQALRDAFRDI